MSRIAWHRNGNWRRTGDAAVARLQPVEVGLPDIRASAGTGGSTGVFARTACRARQPQVNVGNWFFGAEPVRRWRTAASTVSRTVSGVGDHVYTTFEYPGGRTATFSSIESNALDDDYEAFFGTKATLIL